VRSVVAICSDALCEACIAGAGLIRVLAANVEDALRGRTLVQLRPDWECAGAPPIVAVYRRTRPAMPQVGAFVGDLADALRRHQSQTAPRAEVG